MQKEVETKFLADFRWKIESKFDIHVSLSNVSSALTWQLLI